MFFCVCYNCQHYNFKNKSVLFPIVHHKRFFKLFFFTILKSPNMLYNQRNLVYTINLKCSATLHFPCSILEQHSSVPCSECIIYSDSGVPMKV